MITYLIVIILRTETETPTPSINWPTYILNQSYRDTLHLKMITYQLLSKEFQNCTQMITYLQLYTDDYLPTGR